MDATKRWAQEHGYHLEPARRAVLVDIIARLNMGFSLHYVLCWDWVVALTSEVPMPVAIRFSGADAKQIVLNGLFPPECNLLLCNSPDEDPSLTVAMEEMCVVATLATLLHQRDIALDERTASYLHGHAVNFVGRPLMPPAYALAPLFERKGDCQKGIPPRKPRVSLFQCVKDFGWDETADYLAKEQERLQFLAEGRRPPGRPKDEEFDKWASERFAVLRNVGQVVKEAVAEIGLRPDAARKRITRSDWFQRMAAARTTPVHKPAPALRPATGSGSLFLAEVIVKYIRANGPREDWKLAAELGWDLREVKKTLQDRDRFQYQLGNKWDVFR